MDGMNLLIYLFPHYHIKSVARHYWGHWFVFALAQFCEVPLKKPFVLPSRQDSLLLNSHHLDFSRFLLNLIIVQLNSCLLLPVLAKPNHVALSLLVKAAKGVEGQFVTKGFSSAFQGPQSLTLLKWGPALRSGSS